MTIYLLYKLYIICTTDVTYIRNEIAQKTRGTVEHVYFICQ